MEVRSLKQDLTVASRAKTCVPPSVPLPASKHGLLQHVRQCDLRHLRYGYMITNSIPNDSYSISDTNEIDHGLRLESGPRHAQPAHVTLHAPSRE